ncbi:hypothetical protein B0H17DRAFT_1113718, partial [Mycena rosella]
APGRATFTASYWALQPAAGLTVCVQGGIRGACATLCSVIIFCRLLSCVYQTNRSRCRGCTRMPVGACGCCCSTMSGVGGCFTVEGDGREGDKALRGSAWSLPCFERPSKLFTAKGGIQFNSYITRYISGT